MENKSQYDSPFLRPEAPYASSSQTMGILSIVFAWLFTIAGLVLGIVAVVQSRKAEDLINQNPDAYHPISMSKVKTGRTTGIIGIVLSAAIILAIVGIVIALVLAYDTWGHHRCY